MHRSVAAYWQGELESIRFDCLHHADDLCLPFCSPQQTPQLTSISETSTCFYEVQVSTDRVCGDETFPIVSADFPVQGGAGGGGGGGAATALDTGSEDWFLEMVELDGGSEGEDSVVMCQAYSLEYRATSVQTLRFASMALRINRHREGRTEVAQLPAPYRGYTARQAGRIDVDPSALRVGYGAIALDEQAEYEGSISLVKIYS